MAIRIQNRTSFSTALIEKLAERFAHPDIDVNIVLDDISYDASSFEIMMRVMNGTRGEYAPAKREIRLFPESWSARGEQVSVWADIPLRFEKQEDVAAYVLAHELHHAYQHQVARTMPESKLNATPYLVNQLEREAEFRGYQALESLRET